MDLWDPAGLLRQNSTCSVLTKRAEGRNSPRRLRFCATTEFQLLLGFLFSDQACFKVLNVGMVEASEPHFLFLMGTTH